MRCAIIDLDSNAVVNLIEYASVPVGHPPGFEGNKIAVADDQASPGWHWNPVARVTFDPSPPPAPPPQRRKVSSIVVIDRLQAAGKLAAARAAIDAAPLYTRERWNKLDAIYADDADALALLKAIGADPDVILAP